MFVTMEDISSEWRSVVLPVSFLILSIAFLLLKRQSTRKIDPREPPIIPSAIPYGGHLLGLLWYGSRYLKWLGRRNRLPIFTLPMLSGRLYVVTDPSLAMSVQRASKALSFNPIIPPVLKKVPGFDKATVDLIESDMEHGFVQQVQEQVHARLGQGEYLDQLTLRACNEFLVHLNTVSNDSSGPTDLLKWVKRVVTVSTATFFYGPENPVEEDPSLADRFWDFDDGIPGLLVGIFPSVTARKAYKGREAMVKALSEYLTSPRYAQAAPITKERTAIARKFNVDTENTARSDLTFFFAGIINTSLTTFWMVLHIFSRPELLSRIREELESAIERSEESADTIVMNIKRVVKECALLNAVFREVLRLYSDNFATRVVQTDTLLADTYFLRKGSVLQISGGIIHGDSRIWGQDVTDFRPERFLPGPAKSGQSGGAAKAEKIHAAAFRAFGGGTTLCPGRHFALNEITGLVAMIVLMLDIDTAGDRALRIPPKKDNVIPIHVLEPIKKTEVHIRKRDSWKSRRLLLKVE